MGLLQSQTQKDTAMKETEKSDADGFVPTLVRVLAAALVLLLIVAAAAISCGCTLTVRPDGTRTWRPEPETFLRAIEIIAEK